MNHSRSSFCSHRNALTGLLLTLALVSPLISSAKQTASSTHATKADEASLRLRISPLPEGARRVRLTTDEQGRLWFVLSNLDGSEERLDPEAFASRLDRDHHNRRRLYSLLNITSPPGIAWVALGLVGQILFTGRMIVQWIVSEQHRRSVIPVAFWWMSLGGASMLLVYFVWRRDIVGVLGQSAGWVIYARNLWLIHKNRAPRAD